MPRASSEMHEILESPVSQSSTGPTDIKTFAPASKNRANGVWVSVETTAARITFDGTAPGNATGPGVVIPAGATPQYFPFPINDARPLKVASAAAGTSLVTCTFVR